MAGQSDAISAGIGAGLQYLSAREQRKLQEEEAKKNRMLEALRQEDVGRRQAIQDVIRAYQMGLSPRG